MKHKIIAIAAIVASVYFLISPYRIYFFFVAALFGAYTAYRYILFKAQQEG